MRRRLPLLLFGAYLLLASLYNAVIPLGEGPDEIGHLRYAAFLADQQRLPLPAEVPGEGHQPPLGYLPAALLLAWDPAPTDADVLRKNPDFRWSGGDAVNAFERASLEAWPWQGLARDWHLARFASTLWGLAALGAGWAAARRLWPNDQPRGWWLLIPAVTTPQWLFGSGLVSNDTAAAALGGWLLWLTLPTERRAAAASWALGSGVVLGLALLTKLSLAIYVPLLIIAAWQRGAAVRERWLLLLLGAAAAAAVSGWWFVRNLQLSGDLLGYGAFQRTFAGQPFDWFDGRAWLSAIQQLLLSSWAFFGWQTIPAPRLPAAAAALGGLVLAWSAWRVRRTLPLQVWLAVALSMAWLLAFVATAGLVGWQGRLLWPALAAFWLIAASAAAALFQQIRPTQRRTVEIVSAIGLTLPAIWLALGVIMPAYPRIALDPAAARARIGVPVGVQLGPYGQPRIELAGVRMPANARAGETVAVTVMWHSLAVIDEPLQVFVHISTRRGRILAEVNSDFLGGSRPLPRWTPGDWIEDTYRVTLPQQLRAGTYRVIVGLWNPADGRRESVYAADGTLIDAQVDVGLITLAPR